MYDKDWIYLWEVPTGHWYWLGISYEENKKFRFLFCRISSCTKRQNDLPNYFKWMTSPVDFFICSIWHCYHKSTVDRLRLKLFSDTESLPPQPLCQRGKIVSSGIHWERLPMCLPRNERKGTLQRFLYHQCNENQLTLDQEGPTSFIILKSHPWIAR